MPDLSKLQQFIENPMVLRWATIALFILLIMGLNGLVRKALNKSIADTDRKYKARKAMNLLAYLLMVMVVLFVYSDRLGNIGVALGVAGAGIAFALQEVIVSIAGWLTIMLSGHVSVGQRVQIGEVTGDIIDIGVLNTTVMETGAWVNGDLYNGRIVTLSNAFVYKEKVHNFSAEYPFLWDEIYVPIRHHSDHEFARALFQSILDDICGTFADESRQRWERLTNKFRVEAARVDPMVTLHFDENWITFNLRYIVDYQTRRSVRDQISSRLLVEIARHSDRVEIASTAIEVTQMRSAESGDDERTHTS